MTTPFNPAAHEYLLAHGYTHEHHEADWEDIGGPENGPQVVGGPAFDEYTSPEDRVMIGEDGGTGFEVRDLEMEAFFEAMGESWASSRC